MTAYELVNNIDIQGACHFYYYDYNSEERIEITKKEAMENEILYMYCENNEICIEVRWEEKE